MGRCVQSGCDGQEAWVVRAAVVARVTGIVKVTEVKSKGLGCSE